MKATSKLTAVIAATPPKEFPEIAAMTAEQLVEKIKLALEKFYSEGLYSVHLAQMARAMVLITEFINAKEEGTVLLDITQTEPYVKLAKAVQELYYAAVWHADRAVDAERLWAAVRDASGFAPGYGPAPADSTPILVPNEHVAAIQATLGYLTGNK